MTEFMRGRHSLAAFTLLAVSYESGAAPAATQAEPACTTPYADPAPRGAPTSWVTVDDYPQRAQREGRGGKVRFRVNVRPDGRAENVEILEANGDDLARATAQVLTRRGRFKPALRNCLPVPGEYEGAIVWSVPE